MFGRYKMKRILGLLAVTVSLLVTALILPLTGCGEDESQLPPDNGIDYTVIVQSLGKRGIADITVTASLNGEPVTSAQTNNKGKAVLHMEPNEYTLTLSDLPKGYQQSTKVFVTDREATPTTISLASSVINEAAPKDFRYSIGDVAYDFNITDVMGTRHNLSNILKPQEEGGEGKRAVVLNFWATWCGPCGAEFPYLIEAYEAFSDKLELFAVDGDGSDSVESVKEYAIKNGFLFPAVYDASSSFVKMYDASVLTGGEAEFGSVPMTVIIDRYGVVCLAHVGSMTDVDYIKDLFDQYTADNYTQDFEDVGNTDGDSESIREKPDVTMPPSSEIEAAVNNTESGFNFSYYADEDEYSWPWIVTEKDGEQCIAPSNSSKHSSYSIIYTKVHMQPNQVIAFDYWLETEKDNDYVYVQIDGGVSHTFSGRSDGWQTCYAYIPLTEGDYNLSLMYLKDNNINSGEDKIYVKNIRFSSMDEFNASNTSLNIAYHCATDQNLEAGKYDHYIHPELNTNDGYFHVGEANGPLILANLTQGNTRWSDKSIYEYVTTEISNLPPNEPLNETLQTLMEYFGYAGNSAYPGYVPVTQELHDALQTYMAKISGADYAEQWMEICTYFVHYGPGEAPGDPIKGLANFSAYQAQIGENSAMFDRIIVPRGLRFEFIPAQSGVYTIQSINDDTGACWLYDEDGNELSYTDEILGQKNKKKTGDFRMDYYMEAGKTYYISVGFGAVETMKEFKFTINRAADSALVITDCTSGAYTTAPSPTNPNAVILILTDAVKVELREDNYYYTEKGEKIYMDFVNHLFSLSHPIKYCIEEGLFDLSAMGGKDYTADMEEYLASRDKNNLVAVDVRLATIMMNVGTAHDWFMGAENPWLLFCYYYRYEGAAGTSPDENTPTLPDVYTAPDSEEE